jgi:predicted esterase
MKKQSLTLSLLFASMCLYAQTLFSDKVNILTSGTYTTNAVFYTPANYNPLKKYPLVLFMHGMGEAGTNVTSLYNTGLPYVLKNGYKPSFEFIMVAPQRSSYSVDPAWLPGIMKDALSRYSIDTTRIYLTGLSAGGWACFGSQLNIDTVLAKRFAAIVICSGATQDANQSHLNWWKSTKTPLWCVVGDQDAFYGYNKALVDSINVRTKVASLTVRSGIGHTGWNDVYSGLIKTSSGQTMWEWMYGFTRQNLVSAPLPIKANSLKVIRNKDGSFSASFIASATSNTKEFVLKYSSDGINFQPVYVQLPEIIEDKTYSFNFKISNQ